ncbi:MAG TPA: hexose kinase [Planctomycetota bacterium]
MILTVTANPALDYSLRVDDIPLGRRARYRDATIDPSGKGVNVARMVHRLGEPVFALALAGGATGTILAEGLVREGVPHELVPVSAPTRINVTLLSGPDGTATHFHGAGAGVTAEEVDRLRGRARDRLRGARLLVVSGSLPPGMRPADIGDLVRLAREAGVPAIVDAEGEALASAVAAGASLVKPNLAEARGFLGRDLGPLEAAREIASRGVETVVVTMSGDGAVAVRGGRAWKVEPPREGVVRAVGAGDSFAAGLATGLSRGLDFPEALRLAAAAGAATAQSPGTSLGRAEDVKRLLPGVVVTAL